MGNPAFQRSDIFTGNKSALFQHSGNGVLSADAGKLSGRAFGRSALLQERFKGFAGDALVAAKCGLRVKLALLDPVEHSKARDIQQFCGFRGGKKLG